MSSSTSVEVMPGPSVWISTLGGANSGNTSTGILRSCWVPKTNSVAAMASTRKRNLRLEPMIQVNIHRSPPGPLPQGQLLAFPSSVGRTDAPAGFSM